MKRIFVIQLFFFIILYANAAPGIGRMMNSGYCYSGSDRLYCLSFHQEDDTTVIRDTDVEPDSLVYNEGNDSLLTLPEGLGIKINREANIIVNAEALEPFFTKMIAAGNGSSRVISIYHLGDSHVAGKAYPLSVAGHLHDLYGDGKTIVITPRIKAVSHAKVTGRKGKRSSAAAVAAKGKKGKRTPVPIGKPSIKKKKRRSSALFMQADVLPDLAMAKPDQSVINLLSPRFAESDIFQDDFAFPPSDSVKLNGLTINYAAYGVPGKSFKYFADNPNTGRQLREYKPDLVIISLGVNDIFGKRIDEDYIKTNLSRLVALVRQQAPSASILLGFSTDAWVKKKRSNPFLPGLKKILAGFALQNNCAYWDPIPVFGGYGCMNRWYRQNLCVKDRIHLTKPGYALLGEMLVEALDKSFTAFAGKTAR